jgi:hypothetical protein
MDLKEIECGDLNRINPAQDSDQWRDLLNEVMNFRIP